MGNFFPQYVLTTYMSAEKYLSIHISLMGWISSFFFFAIEFLLFLNILIINFFQMCNLQYFLLFYVLSLDCDEHFLFLCRIILFAFCLLYFWRRCEYKCITYLRICDNTCYFRLTIGTFTLFWSYMIPWLS